MTKDKSIQIPDDDAFFHSFCILTGKMAGKNALIRYRAINKSLIEGGASLDEIMKACNNALPGEDPVGKRTIEGDLRAMRENDQLGWHAEIIYDKKIKKYLYKDPDFSIDDIPLNSDELNNLVFAAAVLSQYKDITYFNQFQGSVQKIVNATNLRRREKNESEFQFIDFEKNPLIKGSEYLEFLIDHIMNRVVIEITYQAYNKEIPSVRVLHPQFLKEYRGRWYILGLDEEKNEERTFGLDRIKKIKSLTNKHYRSPVSDVKERFQQIIGMMIPPDKEPEDVVIAFTEFQAKYALSQPIHPSQTLLDKTDNQGRKYLQYHLIPNFELTAILLGWSDQVEVISPEWYRKEVKGIVEGMGRVYE